MKSRHIPTVPEAVLTRPRGLSIRGRRREVIIVPKDKRAELEPEWKHENSFILLCPGGRQAFIIDWTGDDADHHVVDLTL